MAKWLWPAVCLISIHAAAADDFYTVTARVKNDQVLFSPCTHPQTVWLASFDRAADERIIREHIKSYPAVSAERAHAGFFIRLIAAASGLTAEPITSAAVTAHAQTETPQVRLVVREILSLHHGSCNVGDVLSHTSLHESDEEGGLESK